jgi:hypothetical protein
VDANGNILYANLTDLGETHEAAAWMPDIPFIGGQATYHEYLTPGGNLVVLPSATTLFFMALNPEASGLDRADASLGNAQGVLDVMLAGYLSPSDLANLQTMGDDILPKLRDSGFYLSISQNPVNLISNAQV